MQHVGQSGVLDLQPDGPHELEHLDENRVRQLRLAHDVGEQRLGVNRVRHLASQQSRHHFDAGQRVLQFVRDASRHFTERCKPIPQALAFLELLDLGQVLEEHHGACRLPVVVFHLRQRVADDAVEIFQPQLGAVR